MIVRIRERIGECQRKERRRREKRGCVGVMRSVDAWRGCNLGRGCCEIRTSWWIFLGSLMCCCFSEVRVGLRLLRR